jgi:hypothetical protein
MATKKRPTAQEPLLNTVARKLGHAAGTLTKVTYDLTENLSALPETLTAKMHQAVEVGTPKKRPAHAKKKVRRSAPPHKAKRSAGRRGPKPPKSSSPRRRRKPAKVKK